MQNHEEFDLTANMRVKPEGGQFSCKRLLKF